MTDRLKGVVVTFNEDIRVDDAEYIINAIKMIKGVIDVSPNIVNSDDHMIRMRVENEIRQKLWKAFSKWVTTAAHIMIRKITMWWRTNAIF